MQKQRYYFANKGPSSQGYGFSSSHLWMWELDCEESWAPKNWRFWTVVLEKTLESPLDCKEIQPVHSEGDQSWVFFGRKAAKAETLILGPSLVWPLPISLDSWTWHSKFLCNIALYSIGSCFYHQSHPQLENTLVSPLDCKEIQPVHSKGDQSWVFVGRTDAEAETPILWPPHGKSWLIGNDSDAGRDWGQEEKGTTEDEMAGWHHWNNGHEFRWTLEGGDGQGVLSCWNSWGRKESDTFERLN